MGRLPGAVEQTETRRSEELVVSLHMYDQLRSDGSLKRALRKAERAPPTMNHNVLYLVIAALVVATVVFGHQLYQERQKATGIGINVGERGISI